MESITGKLVAAEWVIKRQQYSSESGLLNVTINIKYFLNYVWNISSGWLNCSNIKILYWKWNINENLINDSNIIAQFELHHLLPIQHIFLTIEIYYLKFKEQLEFYFNFGFGV